MKDFLKRHGSLIPQPARIQLETVTAEKLLTDISASPPGALKASLVILAAFRAAFAYNISDFAENAKSKTERAFVHLQQTIVVDSNHRLNWEEAFKKGEAACERLGAVHLLSHGIWSFKAHGVGARTDLVLDEDLLDASLQERAADALVLTEWKKVVKASDADAVAGAARAQAHLYGSGLLSTIELSDQRYIVLVSSDRLPKVADQMLEGVRYRHINIAVTPSTPSKARAETTP